MIVWTAEKLDALEDEIRDTIAGGAETVHLQFGKQLHEIPLYEARVMLHENRALIAAQPQRVYPENREGREP